CSLQSGCGIRALLVTGVQTCALPIAVLRSPSAEGLARIVGREGPCRSDGNRGWLRRKRRVPVDDRGARRAPGAQSQTAGEARLRSEERRVGKEGQVRLWESTAHREAD